ncbi:unnamed protein product [Lepeophtheirus salmonis]|uniref:(salmon louse) hypothetical protein n=1 Tax=Lepeophtheirus salmonis TaxID=72036 RepID=A0A7R8HB19_LEPSM|nr:unnamed protein product [Lepeophtheirus salmonis]CAF2978523.1 unnamed protein product [Lepeophtheirus salmonis]
MIDRAVRSKVSNIELKRSAEKLLAQFQPIAKALDQAHFLANMLDTSLQGKELNEEEMNMTMEYTNEKYAAQVPIIMKYQARSPPFLPFKFTVHVTNTISATECFWMMPCHLPFMDRDKSHFATGIKLKNFTRHGEERRNKKIDDEVTESKMEKYD